MYNDLILADGQVTGTIANIRGQGDGDPSRIVRRASLETSESKGFQTQKTHIGISMLEKLSTEAHELGRYLQLNEVPEELKKLGKHVVQRQISGVS